MVSLEPRFLQIAEPRAKPLHHQGNSVVEEAKYSFCVVQPEAQQQI